MLRSFDTSVLIVGAGPVGLTLAMELASRGVDVTVTETRRAGEPPNVKCNQVSARSMEIFRRLGLADRIRNTGLPPEYRNDVAMCVSVLGTELSRIKLPSRAGRVRGEKPRYVRRELELGGIRLKKGEQIIAMLVVANLDRQANVHPEKLDLERRPNRHIAFCTGIHFCLGHQLARIEGICALKALFRRWPKLQLAVDESQIKWRRRPGLRAIEHLAVDVTR